MEKKEGTVGDVCCLRIMLADAFTVPLVKQIPVVRIGSRPQETPELHLMPPAQAAHLVKDSPDSLCPAKSIAQIPLPIPGCTHAELQSAGNADCLLHKHGVGHQWQVPECPDVLKAYGVEVVTRPTQLGIVPIQQGEVLSLFRKGTEEAVLVHTVGKGSQGCVRRTKFPRGRFGILRPCLDRTGKKQDNGSNTCKHIHIYSGQLRGVMLEKFMPS